MSNYISNTADDLAEILEIDPHVMDAAVNAILIAIQQLKRLTLFSAMVTIRESQSVNSKWHMGLILMNYKPLGRWLINECLNNPMDTELWILILNLALAHAAHFYALPTP